MQSLHTRKCVTLVCFIVTFPVFIADIIVVTIFSCQMEQESRDASPGTDCKTDRTDCQELKLPGKTPRDR